ncbi:MAG: signal peptidase I [Candidatus Hydrogenedentota bacterium]
MDKEKNERQSTENRTPGWVEWVRSIGIAVFLALMIRWPVAEPYKIPSSSMEPTFVPGDRIFVDKHVYGIRYPLNGFRIPFTRKTMWYADNYLKNGNDVERWDIVVFKSNEDRMEHDTLVKRVVGLPGERILIQDGKLLIDGEHVPTPDYLPEIYYTTPIQYNQSEGFAQIRDDKYSLIPEGHVFLMGDNSGSSRDARWFGFMPKHHILGRVTSIWWPIGRWRDLTGYTDSPWWYGFWITLGGWFVIRLFFGRSWSTRSDSLGGLVCKGEHLFVRFALGIPVPFTRRKMTKGRSLSCSDLVVYKSKEISKKYEDGRIGIVAGVAGDKVFLQDGKLLINDKPANGTLESMSFPKEGANDKYGRSKGKEFSTVPDGHIYILTEEGRAQEDSRCLGWIPESDIVGIATRVWWPPTHVRSMSKSIKQL